MPQLMGWDYLLQLLLFLFTLSGVLGCVRIFAVIISKKDFYLILINKVMNDVSLLRVKRIK